MEIKSIVGDGMYTPSLPMPTSGVAIECAEAPVQSKFLPTMAPIGALRRHRPQIECGARSLQRPLAIRVTHS